MTLVKSMGIVGFVVFVVYCVARLVQLSMEVCCLV